MTFTRNLAKPPVCKIVPHTHTYTLTDGRKVHHDDAYHWLRDDNHDKRQDIIDHLKAENQFTQNILEPTASLREKLYNEMVGRLVETDCDAPLLKGDFWYYTRTVAGLQYPIRARRRAHPNNKSDFSKASAYEQILLDLNALDHEFMSVGNWTVSPDHKYLAYSLDTKGNEHHNLYFVDLSVGDSSWTEKAEARSDEKRASDGTILESDTLLDRRISYGLVWCKDSRTVVFDTLDEVLQRPSTAWRYTIGERGVAHQLYYESDEKFELSVDRSNSGEFIFLEASSSLTREVMLLDANQPTLPLRVFQPRVLNTKYTVEHLGNHFYILTNSDNCVNFKLCRTPDLLQTSSEHWLDVFPYNESVYMESMDAFEGHLVIYEREKCLRQIRVLALSSHGCIDDSSKSYRVPITSTYKRADEQVFHGTKLRFIISSLIQPDTTISYDLNTQQSIVLKEDQVTGGHDPSDFEMERIHATASDGTLIPLSVAYRRDAKRPAPCLLYGYGAYGISIDPTFRRSWLSYLSRGFVVAIAHIRGGGDGGRTWYNAGKFHQKTNTFDDFIAAARFLCSSGYTSSKQLAIEGRSAGGLLIGATLNRSLIGKEPLCRAAIAGVPFVDVINTMQDPSIPLTVNEYEEWGNPQEPEFYETMLSYSPYDNVVSYTPHLLARAGLHDPRVQYWEPAKWVAKLRAVQAADSDAVIVLDTRMGAGHFGSTGRYRYLKEVAMEYAFVMTALNVTE